MPPVGHGVQTAPPSKGVQDLSGAVPPHTSTGALRRLDVALLRVVPHRDGQTATTDPRCDPRRAPSEAEDSAPRPQPPRVSGAGWHATNISARTSRAPEGHYVGRRVRHAFLRLSVSDRCVTVGTVTRSVDLSSSLTASRAPRSVTRASSWLVRDSGVAVRWIAWTPYRAVLCS